ncbi:MAG: cytochrome c3 family protein [Candidatus Krumholzibacteriia bacterium]
MSRLLHRAVITATVAVLAGAASQCGCSGGRSHKVISFLFDGVPPPRSTVTPDTSVAVRRERPDRAAASRDSVRASFVMHSPYEDRECDNCHNLPGRAQRASGRAGMPSLNPGAEGSGWLVMAPERLCFECHDDKTAEYAEENKLIIHSPVEEGECLQCHEPHRSRYEHLLRAQRVRTLCFECHEEAIPEGEGDHPELEDEDRCTDCHNPHLSANAFLLD